MQQSYDNAIHLMASNATACSTDVLFWYTHSFKPIPNRDEFRSTFEKRARRAVLAINKFIPDLKAKATRTQAQSDIDSFNKADQYATAVVKFELLMKSAIKDVKTRIDSLLDKHGVPTDFHLARVIIGNVPKKILVATF